MLQSLLTRGAYRTTVFSTRYGGVLDAVPKPDLLGSQSVRRQRFGTQPWRLHELSRGSHLLVDCCEVPSRLCLDDRRILQVLAESAEAAGATVISQVRYRFGSDSPPGCTAIVMLDESHCSAHTYADDGLIAFDFFTCGTTDPHQIWNRVRDVLGLESATVRAFSRFESRADSAGPRDAQLVTASATTHGADNE